MTPEYSRRILWWGRGDKTYSRNSIVLSLLDELGYDIEFFHPRISKLGLLEGQLRKLKCPDYIWVPCFRHDDVLSASYFAKKWKIPLIFDPLISSYQKEVFERKKWPETSNKAIQRKIWESYIFSRPDIIICDTKAHSEYFHESL